MTLSSRTRAGCIVACSALLAFGTLTGSAAATPEPAAEGPDAEEPGPEEPGPEEPGPEWPPPDSEGEWLPAPPELAGTFDVRACDSTVTMSPGDVFDVEYHAMHQSDGTVRIEYRGTQTVDLTRESDGATIDELDVSGAGYELISSDGSTVTFSWYGPSIVGAFDDVEAAAFAAQGLPPLFYYESGNTTERVVFPSDPEATTIESAEFLTDTALGVRDACDMLDDTAE